jgi:hypothetical protein
LNVRDEGVEMGTSIDPGIAALAGTVVGGLISFTTTAWAERRRSQEARAFRNQTERQRAAAEYLAAFDGYRRCIRDGSGPGIIDLSRTHASAIELLGLYFEEPVYRLANNAADCLEKMRNNPSERQSEDEKAKEDRNKVISAMKEQLSEGRATRPAASTAAAR